MRGEENCVDWSAVAGEESECGIPTDVQNSIAVHPSERDGGEWSQGGQMAMARF